MLKKIPLDEQIVAVLRGTCTSEQAALVLADAERELSDLTQRADAADVASLSPLATAAEAKKLRTEASDHRFEADRMEASVAALQARVADLKDAEVEARRQADIDAVRAVRDALAADIAKEYPPIVRALTSLAKRIHDNDKECKRVGIDGAESIGRGVPANFYMNFGPVYRIIDRAIPLPAGKRLAWEETMKGYAWFGIDEPAA